MSRNPFLSLFKHPKWWKTKQSSHPQDSRTRFRPRVEQLETRLLPSLGNRSRVEGDKRIVPENHGERQKAHHFGGNDQEETWWEFRYSFQPFTRPTFRQVAQPSPPNRFDWLDHLKKLPIHL